MKKVLFCGVVSLLLYLVSFSAMAAYQILSDGSIQTAVNNGNGASTEITAEPDGTLITVDVSAYGPVTTTIQNPDGSETVKYSTSGFFN